jgi:Spirocyclase AveC-like
MQNKSNLTPTSSLRGVPAATKIWIVNGALWLILCIYAWSRWIAGPYFKPNTVGRALAPAWYVGLARVVETLSVVVTLFILYNFVVKPKRNTGRLSFDGLFFLGCWLMYIQEPWINWTSLQFLYSTVFVNFGSWCGYIPGWSSPNPEKIPVALIAWGGAYIWIVALPGWFGSLAMTRLKARNPNLSTLQVIGITYLGFMVFDFFMESLFLRTELFSYASTIPALTMFAGTKHQFPVYEILSWSGVYMGIACVHHFRDDHGNSFVERGIDRFRASARVKTFLRFLCIMGACQLSMLITYNLPYQLWALHAGPLLPAFEEYRTAGLCGPKTAYACPDPSLPIARRSSLTNRISDTANSSAPAQ